MQRIVGILLVTAGVTIGATPGYAGGHAGQLLIASDTMADPRFSETVIYICRDEEKGAFGLVLNRPAGDIPMKQVLEIFHLDAPVGTDTNVEVRLGGPVEQDRGYLVHSDDFDSRGAVCHMDGIEVSASRDVLEALAAGKGPTRAVLFIGYAGWAPGQLDAEISNGDWETIPADPRFILGGDPKTLWSRAMKLRGTDL